MTVVRHISATAIGQLPGGEIFNFGLSIAPGEEPGGQWMEDAGVGPNATVWDDLRDDFVTYFGNSGAHADALLKSVKFAFIGTDGKYEKAPVERLVNAGAGQPGNFNAARHPNQTAMAVTLHTPGDLGRVKGRFYVPIPGAPVESDGLISEATRDLMETAAQTFVNNVNNQPGLDVLNLRVVVASSGRHNANGTVKIGPQNHVVNAVSVGRAFDTIRRRRNKLNELRGTVSAVS